MIAILLLPLNSAIPLQALHLSISRMSVMLKMLSMASIMSHLVMINADCLLSGLR